MGGPGGGGCGEVCGARLGLEVWGGTFAAPGGLWRPGGICGARGGLCGLRGVCEPGRRCVGPREDAWGRLAHRSCAAGCFTPDVPQSRFRGGHGWGQPPPWCPPRDEAVSLLLPLRPSLLGSRAHPLISRGWFGAVPKNQLQKGPCGPSPTRAPSGPWVPSSRPPAAGPHALSPGGGVPLVLHRPAQGGADQVCGSQGLPQCPQQKQ